MKRRLLILSMIVMVLIPLLSGCSNPELVIGQWDFTYKWSNGDPGTQTIEFMQDRTFEIAGMKLGTWSLSGRKITFTANIVTEVIYTGAVNSDGTLMSGTMSNSFGNTGTWSAVR